MVKKIIIILFIITFSVIIWNICVIEEEPICNEVIHSIKLSSFTEEQSDIINKYLKIIYSKLLHPDMYFIYSMEEFPDKIYKISLLPLEKLQSYYQVGNNIPPYGGKIANCGNVMDISEDTWFVFDDYGNILMSRYINRDSILVE